MASHHRGHPGHHCGHHGHHCHHLQQPPPPQPSTSPYCCCADRSPTSCCASAHQPPPSPPLDLDHQLLDCIIARLLQSHPPPAAHNLHHRRRQLNTYDLQQQSLLYSLVYRIESLESSVHSLSISSSSPLRDAAARVIQTHFRSLLARRSRTLRHLKDLASIKSSFLALKSSMSNISSSRLNLVSVSEKAMDLLLQLDAIQNHDPMIRDGKRSISRDLDAFLDYIDRLAVQRHESLIVRKSVKVVPNRNNKSKILREQKELVDKLKSRVEKIRGLSRVLRTEEEEDVELEGFQNFSDDGEENGRTLVRRIRPGSDGRDPRVKKSVSFSEKGNVYRVISSDHDQSSSGDDDSESNNEHGEIPAEDGKSKGSYVIVKDYEEDGTDDSASSESRGRDESEFTFPTTVPERMELREDMAKKRNVALKIGT